MQVLEQIESVDREKLKQQNHIHEDTECSEEINSFTSTTIYGHVNQHMEKNISNTLRKIYDTFTSYNKSGRLPNDEAIENLAKRFQKLIEDAKKNKVMFSVSYHIDVFKRWDREELSIIDYSILVLDRLMNKDANVTKIGRTKLMPLWSEMSDLVSKGNNVSEEASKKLQGDILQNRKSHLSTLKQIVIVIASKMVTKKMLK